MMVVEPNEKKEKIIWVVCYQTYQMGKPILTKAFNDEFAALKFIKMTENKFDSGYYYIEEVSYQEVSDCAMAC